LEEAVSGPLDPRTIEQEISRIREKESSPFSSGTKTNLFTILIFRGITESAPGAADPVESTLSYLLGKRPARIITLSRSRADKTEAWVSGRCYPDRKNRGVCFEEVRIESGDDGVGADPGAWAPLVIRELPVIAWMPDDVEKEAELWEPTLRQAAGIVDKMVVNTSRSRDASGDGERALRALARLRESLADDFIISDFSWRRGRVLREQSARAFDPSDMRSLLPAIRKVRLYGGSPAEAWLFFEWLRARLHRDVHAEHAFIGPLDEGFKVTFVLEDAPAVDIGCTKGGCLSRGEEKAGYRAPSDGEILMEEVDVLTRDPVFLEVLAHAGQ
jgi:hypothetical protein